MNIVILTLHNNNFWSKLKPKQHGSSMSISKIKEQFKNHGFKTKIFTTSDFVNNIKRISPSFLIYSGYEVSNSSYNSFIVDVITYSISLGFVPIPNIEQFKCYNNKVFMEMTKDKFPEIGNTLFETMYFGSLKELTNSIDSIHNYPKVVKGYFGAGSKSVFLAKDKKSLIKVCKKISNTSDTKLFIKDLLRVFKYKSYIRNSMHTNKFIIQNYIPKLKYDYKVLVYYDKFYVLKRNTRKNDFRASGSGLIEYNIYNKIDKSLLDYAKVCFNCLNVPFVSLDIVALEAETYFLVEFQSINFGPATQQNSDGYFMYINGNWIYKKEIIDLEIVYAESVLKFIQNP